VRKWELYLEEKTGVQLINPFYDVERQEIQRLNEGLHMVYDKHISRVIVESDLSSIEQCDAMLVILPTHSIGCAMELYHAKTIGMPVAVYTNMNHPWIIALADVILHDLNDVLQWILRFKEEKESTVHGE